jgi:CheY-like chemotaxis protein
MATVLVVDDSLSVRKAVLFALKPRQLDVIEAESGRQALELIRSKRPDLVVCDVIMRDGGGYEVCQALQEDPALKSLPVILISGIVNDQVRNRAAQAGAAKVISKPFRAGDLADDVQRLLGTTLAASRPSVAWPAQDSAAGVVLRAMMTVPGVTFAAMADDQGRTLEHSGQRVPELDALVGQLAEVALRASGVGKSRGLDGLNSVIFEFGTGLMVAQCLAHGGLLLVEVNEPSALGRIRYEVRRVLATLSLPSLAATQPA